MYLRIHDETIKLGILTLDFVVYTGRGVIECGMRLKICKTDDIYIFAKKEYTLPTNVTTGSMFTLLYLQIATQVEKEHPELMEPLRNLMQKSSFRQW